MCSSDFMAIQTHLDFSRDVVWMMFFYSYNSFPLEQEYQHAPSAVWTD